MEGNVAIFIEFTNTYPLKCTCKMTYVKGAQLQHGLLQQMPGNNQMNQININRTLVKYLQDLHTAKYLQLLRKNSLRANMEGSPNEKTRCSQYVYQFHFFKKVRGLQYIFIFSCTCTKQFQNNKKLTNDTTNKRLVSWPQLLVVPLSSETVLPFTENKPPSIHQSASTSSCLTTKSIFQPMFFILAHLHSQFFELLRTLQYTSCGSWLLDN